MEIKFSDILKDFLEEKGLSQVSFAKIIDVKQSQVSEWLKVKAKPSYDILRRMSIAFDISADYFLGIVEEY